MSARIVSIVAILLASAGCKGVVERKAIVSLLRQQQEPEQISCDGKKYSPNDLHLAALEIIYPRVIHLGRPATTTQISAARVKLADLKQWASTVQMASIRAEYLSWIQFYESQYDEAEASIVEKIPTDSERREQERQEQEVRTRHLATCLPTPKGGGK